MAGSSSRTDAYQAVDRVRLGKLVTTRDEDNRGAKYLIAHPIAYDILIRRRPDVGILSIGWGLGYAIFNARVGEMRTYERGGGEIVSVWIVLIENDEFVPSRLPAPEPIAAYATAA
jgi:transcription elongation GreA/GreB family factor